MEFFINIIVYCNFLGPIKAAFVETKKSKNHRRNFVHHPTPYFCSKQSKIFHAKGNLMVNCEKECL